LVCHSVSTARRNCSSLCLGFFRCKLDPFAPVQQRRDLHLAVDRALAANFGGVRGQNRTDQGGFEKAAQVGRAEAGRARMRKRQRQRARARAPGAAERARICRMLFWSSAMLARCEK